MTMKTVGEEAFTNPLTVTAMCKTCGDIFVGAFQLLEHLDDHEIK
jgi:hypothetical protein